MSQFCHVESINYHFTYIYIHNVHVFSTLTADRQTAQVRPVNQQSHLKGCVQEARKWLFRPNFFSLSKWAQFLHVTLDLTGKRCPVIFSAVLFFIFEKFSSTSTGGKCTLRWFYCLEKQKLSLERTPPGKKLRFCIRYLWKMKEKPANLNRGVYFSMKWKATCWNWAHLDEEKQFGLKSHLRVSCTQPFICAALNWIQFDTAEMRHMNWALSRDKHFERNDKWSIGVGK